MPNKSKLVLLWCLVKQNGPTSPDNIDIKNTCGMNYTTIIKVEDYCFLTLMLK